jgi:hypothetical protein
VVIKRGAMGVLAGDASGERWQVPACTVSRVGPTQDPGIRTPFVYPGTLRQIVSKNAVNPHLVAGTSVLSVEGRAYSGTRVSNLLCVPRYAEANSLANAPNPRKHLVTGISVHSLEGRVYSGTRV